MYERTYGSKYEATKNLDIAEIAPSRRPVVRVPAAPPAEAIR